MICDPECLLPELMKIQLAQNIATAKSHDLYKWDGSWNTPCQCEGESQHLVMHEVPIKNVFLTSDMVNCT